MTYLSFTKGYMGTDVFHHPPRNNLYLTSKVKVVICCDPGNYEHIRLDSVYLTKVSWERKKRALSYTRWALVSIKTPSVLLPAHPVQRMHSDMCRLVLPLASTLLKVSLLNWFAQPRSRSEFTIHSSWSPRWRTITRQPLAADGIHCLRRFRLRF